MSDAYWQESFETTLDEMGLYDFVKSLSDEQRAEIGKALNVSHENYGLSHYSPPPSDRTNSIEREWQGKIDRLQSEFDAYRSTAEKAVGRILRVHRDDAVSIDKSGDVYRHGGRTERIG